MLLGVGVAVGGSRLVADLVLDASLDCEGGAPFPAGSGGCWAGGPASM